MFPRLILRLSIANGLPRESGSASLSAVQIADEKRASARQWGCFLLNTVMDINEHVFPTPVGVFPSIRHLGQVSHRLPLTSGGAPIAKPKAPVHGGFSPCPWGCFFDYPLIVARRDVFLDPAGSPQRGRRLMDANTCLPYASVGVSWVKHSLERA